MIALEAHGVPGVAGGRGPTSVLPELDAAMFADVEEMLGRDRARIIVEKLRSKVAGFVAAVGSGDAPSLARQAHELTSDAGLVGLLRLASASEDLERAARRGGDVARCTDDVVAACRRAFETLDGLAQARRSLPGEGLT